MNLRAFPWNRRSGTVVLTKATPCRIGQVVRAVVLVAIKRYRYAIRGVRRRNVGMMIMLNIRHGMELNFSEILRM